MSGYESHRGVNLPALRSLRNGGFSLVELLVSMAISTLLLGVILLSFRNGVTAAGEAGKAGEREIGLLELRLEFSRDVSNIMPMHGYIPTGNSGGFRCLSRGISEGVRQAGELTYSVAGGVILRRWSPLPAGVQNSWKIQIKPDGFRYLVPGEDGAVWVSDWSGTNFPVAIRILLPGEHRMITAELR